jgi:Tfp pilus assembly protein PilF
MNSNLINNLENLLAKGQDNALLRFSLGSAYLQQNDYTKAAEHLACCVALDPLYSAAWKHYAKALSVQQLTEQAITAYEQGIIAAQQKGDKQAEKEMHIFLKRLQKNNPTNP